MKSPNNANRAQSFLFNQGKKAMGPDLAAVSSPAEVRTSGAKRVSKVTGLALGALAAVGGFSAEMLTTGQGYGKVDTVQIGPRVELPGEQIQGFNTQVDLSGVDSMPAELPQTPPTTEIPSTKK